MHFSHISIGGGITGLETIISTFDNIEKELKKSKIKRKKLKYKKFIFAIIDKNSENIPGGVAYGFKASRYGYFNNPIRLSPKKFTNWLLFSCLLSSEQLSQFCVLHGLNEFDLYNIL